LEFPRGFFDRFDQQADGDFYRTPRLVTHIDERAIAAVGALYDRLGLRGRILDLMSSWISHFTTPPEALVTLGMNGPELAANGQASGAVIADLNRSASLPFASDSFDGATCCVSVDYLIRPVEVFAEVGRVLVPGATFCCTFSNRCFPTKAIAGWLSLDSRGRSALVAQYFARSGCWTQISTVRATPPGPGDPLHAVWATRT
jgi:SAM-dependent methyltransferase